jgi:hypothetical protein
MRFNTKTNSLVWISEGARGSPYCFCFARTCYQTADLRKLCEWIRFARQPEVKEERGPRNNSVLEGLTFDKNYKTLYANIEEPLYEDDNPASITKGGLMNSMFDAKSRKNTAQPIYWILYMNPSQRSLCGQWCINNQYYSKDQLLVVERSTPQERKPAL